MIDIKKMVQVSGIQPGDFVADFGAGSGFIATEIAKAVGDHGKLFAIDILEEPLEVIKSKSRQLGLLNIETIKSDLEKENGSTLGANTVHATIIANLLLQIDDPSSIIKETRRILKQGGKVIVVEWQPEKVSGGNFAHNQKTVVDNFQNQGFEFVKEFAPGPNHYGLIFQK